MQYRLDKYLADAGFGTRSEVRRLVKKGSVTVDDVVAKTPDQKVDINRNRVLVDGVPVFFEEFSYYILHKPAGVLSAARDTKQKTVVDLIPEPKRRDLFPVGRLDKDTTGFLLITNDGKLSNRLLSPGKHVEKVYRAVVTGSLPDDLEAHFREGVDIGDETLTAPADVRLIPAEGDADEIIRSAAGNSLTPEEIREIAADVPEETCISVAELTITEGRYHQVKRMFEAVGGRVVFLKRISMGKLTLPEDLAPGEAVKISMEEIGF